MLLTFCDCPAQGSAFMAFTDANGYSPAEARVSIRKVIDDRADKSSLGTYTPKNSLHPLTVIMQGPFEKTIYQYLASAYPEKEEKLIMVIEEFECGSRTEEKKNFTHATISVSYCISSRDSLKYIASGTQRIEVESRVTVESMQKRFYEALDALIQTAPVVDWEKTYPDHHLSHAEVRGMKPVYVTDSIHPGIFNSPFDFLNNAPSDSALYRVKITSGKTYFMHRDSNRMVDKRNYWGYSQDNVLYINTRAYRDAFMNGPPHAMMRTYGHGPLIAWFDDVTETGEMIGMAISGMLTGVMVSYVDLFVWDTRNGQISNLKITDFQRILSEFPDLLEGFRNENADENLGLWVYYLLEYNQRWVALHSAGNN